MERLSDEVLICIYISFLILYLSMKYNFLRLTEANMNRDDCTSLMARLLPKTDYMTGLSKADRRRTYSTENDI